jgi:hypothetical protein
MSGLSAAARKAKAEAISGKSGGRNIGAAPWLWMVLRRLDTINELLTIWVRDWPWRHTCIKGGADGYPNVCRTRRKNACAGFGFGDTTEPGEVETLWHVGNQRRAI